MALPAEGASSAWRCWAAKLNEAVLSLYSPFLVCLASGKLAEDNLRLHILQIAELHRSFATMCGNAKENAVDVNVKNMLLYVEKYASNIERKTNNFLAGWGVDSDQRLNPAAANYISLMIAAARGEDEREQAPEEVDLAKVAVYTAAVLTPCIRYNALLVKVLKMLLRHDESDYRYKEWFKKFSSYGVKKITVVIEKLFDYLCCRLTGKEIETIEKIYHQGLKHMIAFLSAQPIEQPTVIPLTRLHNPRNRLAICSDFDLTCTEVDSYTILAKMAEDRGTDISSLDIRDQWEVFFSKEEYIECIKSVLLKQIFPAETFDYEGLYKVLEQLSDFEKRLNSSKVFKSGVFSGMDLDHIKKKGEDIILQNGCANFFQKVVKKKEKLNADLHIISCCFCADLIRSRYSSAIGCLGDLSIHSNEFKYERDVSTGEIKAEVACLLDKVETFKRILSSSNSNEQNLSVYVGVSVGDLLCLLEADIGIVIGSNERLREMGEWFGVSFVPLLHGLTDKQRQLVGGDTSIWKGRSGVLYTVSSWLEVLAFVLGA